eukprot:1704986-Pyramimonas_sp.AAC.1
MRGAEGSKGPRSARWARLRCEGARICRAFRDLPAGTCGGARARGRDRSFADSGAPGWRDT